MIRGKNKRAGIKKLKALFNILKNFDIDKEVFLTLISKEFSNDKNNKIIEEVLLYAKNIRIIEWGKIFYKDLRDNNTYEYYTTLKYEIKGFKKFKVADRCINTIKDVKVRISIEDKNAVISPLFLKVLYVLAYDKYQYDKELSITKKELMEIEQAQTNILAKIPESNIIFVLLNNTVFGTIRKFKNKFYIKQIGIEDTNNKYIDRKELILLNPKYRYCVKINNDFKEVKI